LKDSGDCLFNEFDQDLSDCQKKGNREHVQSAQKNKIRAAYPLFNSKTEAEDKIQLTKRNIVNGFPVAIGMSLRKNFLSLSGGIWDPNKGDSSKFDDHAMVVVGYDNDLNAFEIMNSWGTDWNKDGFVWVSYEDFTTYVVQAYYFLLDEESEVELPAEEFVKPVQKLNIITGGFNFNYPNDGKMITAVPEYQGKHSYSLLYKEWKIGDQFQLEITGLQKGRHIYVVSIDSYGLNVHWPKNQDLNNQANGIKETSLIPFEDVSILIPGEEKAFYKRSYGTDQLIIFYSSQEIIDFNERLNRVKGRDLSIHEMLKIGFDDLIIDEEKIQYELNGMNFTAIAQEKTLVPLVLSVPGHN